MELLVPDLGNFAAMVTALNPEAPPILQWDRADRRNPVSWYLYNQGSRAERWLLQSNAWVQVTAVSMQPSMWFGGEFKHQGEGVIFVLDGARDSGHQGAGLALFPEILKTELHGVRSTIEAFSRAGSIAGYDQSNANGLKISKGHTWSGLVRLRVTDRTSVRIYSLDRWD